MTFVRMCTVYDVGVLWALGIDAALLHPKAVRGPLTIPSLPIVYATPPGVILAHRVVRVEGYATVFAFRAMIAFPRTNRVQGIWLTGPAKGRQEAISTSCLFVPDRLKPGCNDGLCKDGVIREPGTR